MVFLYFYNELYAVQPWIKHFVATGDLQRPALDRRRRSRRRNAMSAFILRRLLLDDSDVVRRARRRVSAVVRGRPGDPVESMVGERADTRDDRSRSAPSCTSTIRCPSASATTWRAR